MNLGGGERVCVGEESPPTPCMSAPTEVGVSPGLSGGAPLRGAAPIARAGIAQGRVGVLDGHCATLGVEQKREREEDVCAPAEAQASVSGRSERSRTR